MNHVIHYVILGGAAWLESKHHQWTSRQGSQPHHTFGSHDPRICVGQFLKWKKKLVVCLVYIGDEILPSGDYFCFSHSEHDFMVKIWRFGIRHLPDKLFFSVKIPTTWCLLTRSGRRLKFKKSSKRPLVTGFQRSSDRMWEIITNSPQYAWKKARKYIWDVVRLHWITGNTLEQWKKKKS